MSSIKESIFSHGVALYQSGRLKSTIYAKGRSIFIFNQDKTVLLNFEIPSRESPINGSISFVANDYDSKNFEEKEGKIVFHSSEGDYKRAKSCVTPGKTFSDIKDIYQKYEDEDSHKNEIKFDKSIISLLDESLSHMEVFTEDKQPVVLQRDLYSGSILRIDKKEKKGFGLGERGDLKKDLSPIGIRTNDFIALFSFCNTIIFRFGEKPFIFIKGDKWNMKGIVSGCVYDEMGNISKSSDRRREHGRKKPKIRRSK